MRRVVWTLVWLTVASSAYGETVYVTERLVVPLHGTFAEEGPIIKSIEVGAALEVLERVDKFTHVRDAAGADGWIESRFLVTAPPARAQLERLQADLAKARKDATDAHARVTELEAILTHQGAQAATAAAERPQEPTPVTAETDNDFNVGWLVLAFAMLGLGFGAGVVYLRERHRKKLGGMYLRI
jgi:hypothetical protein